MTEKILQSGSIRPALVVIFVGAVMAGLAGWYIYPRHSRIAGIRNVVLISIDTCRADHLSCYGYKRPTTPHIDAVARDGVFFQQALTPVPLTPPAHSSMLTGTYPPTHGVRLNTGERLADSNVTLAEILREAGYQTAAFVGGFPLDARFGLNQGFDTYDCQFTKNDKSKYIAERSAEEVNRPALAWLAGHAAKPVFLFLHYYDAHALYRPPGQFASQYADDPYAGEIAYVDHCIGEVVDRLRALGMYDNTLLIITGDHGESLGEHGEDDHGYYIYQSTLRVPLVIRSPHGRKDHQVADNVSLVDIVPTVLDLVGLKIPPQVQGVSLRRNLEGGSATDKQRPVYCESLDVALYGCNPLHGIVEDQWKYIRSPKPELYDLSRDAGEQRNLIEKEPAIAQQLRGRLETMLPQMEVATPESGRSMVDPANVKRLQSLGYIGGGVTPPPAAFDPKLTDPKDFLPTYKRLQKANSLFLANRAEEAKQELLEIVASHPQLLTAHAFLAQIAESEDRLDEAVSRQTAIVSILTEPTGSLREDGEMTGELAQRYLAQAHYSLGILQAVMGKPGEAVGHYREVLRLKPDDPGLMSNLAWILAANPNATVRDGIEAVQLAEHAFQLTGHKEVELLDVLAAAYAEAGRFPEAVATAEAAATLAKSGNQSAAAREIESRLALYRACQPYREPLRQPLPTPTDP